MNFSQALEEIKTGQKVARSGWNGKRMWIALQDSFGYRMRLHGEVLEIAPYIAMRTADEKYVPWLASQTDILATDWENVN